MTTEEEMLYFKHGINREKGNIQSIIKCLAFTLLGPGNLLSVCNSRVLLFCIDHSTHNKSCRRQAKMTDPRATCSTSMSPTLFYNVFWYVLVVSRTASCHAFLNYLNCAHFQKLPILQILRRDTRNCDSQKEQTRRRNHVQNDKADR